VGVGSTPPVTPVTTTSSQPTSANCSSVPNSIALGIKCVCTVGYLNISNSCASLTSLTLLVLTPANTIKAEPACPPQQSYSAASKQCLCKDGYAMVQGQCVLCQAHGPFLGNETCFPLPNTNVCRTNYSQSGSYCLLCTALSPHSLLNQSCINCPNGFSYNGTLCVCPPLSQIVNQTCIGLKCGNGKIDRNETCDDGNVANGDGCSSNCLIESGFQCRNVSEVCVRAVCGDGLVSGG
jgi:cysteine-rich repeat protein